jgi:hypothetical protein
MTSLRPERTVMIQVMQTVLNDTNDERGEEVFLLVSVGTGLSLSEMIVVIQP